MSKTTLDAVPQAVRNGDSLADRRLGPLKDLHGYFPFTPPDSAAAWATRRKRVRRQVQVSLGLWPLPSRTPLNAVIHGRLDCGDHTVEKVFFESLPGFFVTGSLYRPKDLKGPVPGVLYAHGHWANGRFHDAGAESVRKQIADGGELYEEGGRSPLQAMCVQTARMGCTVFFYDMIGYADSCQIPFEIAHKFAKQRPEMNTPKDWGLFSPQAEARCQSVMGLQTWNSMRALDFLLALPEVDPTRIAVTGGSGGGTQTMMLCALDPRPALSFPAVMVSTAMQGGCTCENASGLRVDTGNVEFAALFAPKPQGMTTANDWTKEMSTKGFPELQQLYALLGAPDNVMLARGERFGHNYNHISRMAFCRWLKQHFNLPLEEPITEHDYRRLSREQLTVWDNAHPAPAAGPDEERRILRWLTADAARQIHDAASDAQMFETVVRPAVGAVLGRNLTDVASGTWEAAAQADAGLYRVRAGVLRDRDRGEAVPTLVLEIPGQATDWTVIWVSPEGKSGLFEAAGPEGTRVRPKPEIRQLLALGARVIGLDLLGQGESVLETLASGKTRRVSNPREAAAYTFGYNYSLFAHRVHDILSVVRFARGDDQRPATVDLVGLAGAGHWVAAARSQCGEAVARTCVDSCGFRFGGLRDARDPDFLPGGAKYGDLPGMLALAAPGSLWVAGEDQDSADLIGGCYRRAGQARAFTRFTGPQADTVDAAVAFLLTGRGPHHTHARR